MRRPWPFISWLDRFLRFAAHGSAISILRFPCIPLPSAAHSCSFSCFPLRMIMLPGSTFLLSSWWPGWSPRRGCWFRRIPISRSGQACLSGCWASFSAGIGHSKSAPLLRLPLSAPQRREQKKSPIIGYEPKLSFFTFKPSEVCVHASS